MSKPNQIYYDLLQTNLENNDSDPILCQFSEQRNQTLIENPQDYKFSIIRFMIETPALPLFRPTIQYTDDPNLTIYSITLKRSIASPVNGVYNSNEIQQQYIEWTPQDITKSTPKAPLSNTSGLQDNSTGYYNCYNYSWFLKLINDAFETARTTLGISNSPTILFDTASQLFVLSAPKNNYDTGSEEELGFREIYMNKSLYQLFSSFPAVNVSHSINNGLNYRIETNNFKGFSTTTIQTDNTISTPSLMVYGEYSTLYLWSPISAIVFTSSTLPIFPSISSSPVLIREGQIISPNSIEPNTRKIITDLVAVDSYKPYLVYTPSSQYRYIDMIGGSALKDIDIQVYFQDKNGILNEFKLSSGSSCSLKILFEKKIQT